MDKAEISLDRVSYAYSSTQGKVLHGLTAEFHAGRIYCIMGKSGSGKSTLLSLLSGLDVPTSGKVLYKGEDVSRFNRDEYRSQKIGVIFQSYNLLTNATAVENIVLSMNVSGVKEKNKKQFVLDLLKKLDIDEETARRKVLKMSGGEQQRVGIARALSHNPDIVIADEPTGNLDGDTEEMIMEILKKLAHEENKCVIVVTHSKAVSRYADELWGLNRGKLVYNK